VEQLIENSATFAAKTDFAQQKYVKKKKRKYVTFCLLVIICRILYSQQLKCYKLVKCLFYHQLINVNPHPYNGGSKHHGTRHGLQLQL